MSEMTRILTLFAVCAILSEIVMAGSVPAKLELIVGNPKQSFFAAKRDPLIWYYSTKLDSIEHWTNLISDYLQAYQQPNTNLVNCDYDRPPTNGDFCDYDISSLGPCVVENRYGYHKSQPCVFLKLTTEENWTPEAYTNQSSLPKEMPQDLAITIMNQRDGTKNNAWVSCEGENVVDKDNIGSVSYMPRRAMPFYYFPAVERPGYLQPLVALHFEHPMRLMLIRVICKVWAQNIDAEDREAGALRFGLMLD